jgi:predicted amino acid racemase/arginase family enzyme
MLPKSPEGKDMGDRQMLGPQVTIDLARIKHNASTVVAACRSYGIDVFGVTKGACGMPQVARAMLSGGVVGIAESRFENIRRLRESGVDCPIMLLRSPPFSRAEEVVRSVDVSLNSELAIIGELSRVAERMGRVHDIILMVDLGDLREGIWPSDLEPTVERVLEMPGVRIAGLGTNLTCFGAIVPTEENLGQLVELTGAISTRFGLQLNYVSGGNSSSLPLLLAGRMPKGINNLRIGEAILQGGRDSFLDAPWDALERDVFLLTGELLEVKRKPSLPIGRAGVDAFGNRPIFKDKGERLRGIVNIGREDVVAEGLEPIQPGVTVEGASSDHLIIDVTDARPRPSVGDAVTFRMNYGALLAAMTSEYVEKMPMNDLMQPVTNRQVAILARQDLVPMAQELAGRLRAIGFEGEVDEIEALSILAALRGAATPLLLGHDHRTTYAGLKCLAQACDAFGLVWLDAEAGFMPLKESEDLAARSVLHRALAQGSKDAVMPHLSPENVVVVGLRNAAPAEAEAIKASRVTTFTMVDIDALGIRDVMRQALRIAMAGTRGFLVSYSPRVTDLPGTAFGSGGITVRETHQAMEMIAQCGGMLAMDVVDLDPGLDPRIVAEISHFVQSAFGKRIL